VKGSDYFGIELAIGPLVQLCDRGFVRTAFAINAVTGDRIESVGDGKDARADVDVFTF
jgi:hypothetical protein